MSTANLTLPHFANRSAFKKGIISDLFCNARFCAVTAVTVRNGEACSGNRYFFSAVTAVPNFLKHLTVKPLVDILYPLSPLAKVGSRRPCKGEKSPLTLVVFFRPSFLSNTGLIRVVFVMVDCLRETLRSLARSFAGTTNLTQSTALCFVAAGSGTPSHKGVTTMSRPKSTQTDKANLLATLKQDLDNTINALPVQHSVKFRKALNHVQVVCDFLSKNLHNDLNFEQIVDTNLLCLHEMRERQALADTQNQNS